jgi:hypothetical protein
MSRPVFDLDPGCLACTSGNAKSMPSASVPHIAKNGEAGRTIGATGSTP